MSLEAYRKWLIGIWGAGFLIPFILILIQFANGKYGGKFAEALGWLTALTLPTILLMIGVMVANPSSVLQKSSDPTPDREKTDAELTLEREAAQKAAHETFIFRLAVGVSIVYLLIVNFVFFLEPFAYAKPQDLMRDSKIFLAVFDSIISLLIGYFFGKK
jgi:uncharacterized protein YqhQ